MECLFDDVLQIILSFLSFHDLVVLRRINRQYHQLISNSTTVEVDHHVNIPLLEYILHFPHYKTEVEQKRNRTLEWDDYRGFFIITQLDRQEWFYYDGLLQKYFFTPHNSSIPHYRGQIQFYEMVL